MNSAAGDLRIGLLADFNTQNLAVILRKIAGSGVECVEAPYNQTTRLLLDASDSFWARPYDALLIWTLPELAAATFQQALALEGFSSDELMGDVDAFCEMVRCVSANVRSIFVPTWGLASSERGLGVADLIQDTGIARTLMRMNVRLIEGLSRDPRVMLIDSTRWLTIGGVANPKLWYMAKTPFTNPTFHEAATDILAALDGLGGKGKKVVVVDLDNTLWGGVVGDDGKEGLRLGGHDPLGEAFVDLQKQLKRLTRRGVILAIVSKNDESVALDAIRHHPEMILGIEDFAAWRINWNDKAANIADLVGELNVGLDSVVFLDDSAFERARVREALPQVFVPELPEDPTQYPSCVARLKCFDNPRVSDEDRTRTRMYTANRERTAMKAQYQSLEEWLAALKLRVRVELLTEASLERASQLFNKTNQMNLSTRRMTAPELLAWSRTPNQKMWIFRVEDKFGDYGLCGIASLVQRNGVGEVKDFLLSCRVLGRGVEESMVWTVADAARRLRCSELVIKHVPTPKNQPCLEWFANYKPAQSQGNEFRISLSEQTRMPAHVHLETEGMK